MMKKFVTVMLSLAMALSLAACGGDKNASSSGSSPSTQSTVSEAAKNDTAGNAAEPEVSEPESTPAEEVETQDVEAENAEVSDELMDFLAQLSIIEPTDVIIGTGWEFAGGRLGGEEMDEEQAAQSLETYGGSLNIVFDDEENMRMVQGGGTMNGTYGLADDGYTLVIAFNNGGTEIPYAGVFADVEDTVVLMLIADETGQNVIYFTQITEE